jgi:hypothetical protein
MREILRREPSPDREFLTGVAFLGAGGDAPGHVYAPDRMLLVERALRRIRAAAEAVGAATVVAVIPGPAQVCDPEALPLFPRGVDLRDRARWDVDLPQRIIEATVRRAGFAHDDLRAPLRASRECPYQRRNLHFTALGHRLVADHLAASWPDLVPGGRARTAPGPTTPARSSR